MHPSSGLNAVVVQSCVEGVEQKQEEVDEKTNFNKHISIIKW